MFSVSSKLGGSNAETLLSHSQQLRAEFTFLLRTLDQCGEGPPQHSKQGGAVIFSYALEVALTLVRFDVLLSLEERKLLVHAFDQLLHGELRSLHLVEKRIKYCADFADSLRSLKQRCLVLDCVDWFHVIANNLCQRDEGALSGGGVGVGGAGVEVTTTPIGVDVPQLATMSTHTADSACCVGEALSTNAARIYSSILTAGVYPPGLLPRKDLDQTVRSSSDCRRGGDEADPVETPKTTVLVSNDDFTVAAEQRVLSTAQGATPFSPQQGASSPRVLVVPSVRYAAALGLPPATAQWATETFTSEQCRYQNDDNHVLTLLVPVVYGCGLSAGCRPPEDVSFSSSAQLDASATGSAFVQLPCATLMPQSGPFSPAPVRCTRESSRDEEEACYSLASTVNDVTPTQLAHELEHPEIARRNISSTIKSAGLSRVGSQHSVDTTAAVVAAASSAAIPAARNHNNTVSGLLRTAPTQGTTPSRQELGAGSPASLEGTNNAGTARGAARARGARVKEVLTPQEELVYRVVQSALLRFDERWSHLRGKSSGNPPACNNTSLAVGGRFPSMSILSPDDIQRQKLISGPICQEIDALLESIEVSISTLQSIKKQIRSEITLLCFRVVSSVVDLLLPAAECRGKAMTMFYRKWLCDVYRVLSQEHLLRGFSSLVHRAKHVTERESAHTSNSNNAAAVWGRVSPNGASSSSMRASSRMSSGANGGGVMPQVLRRTLSPTLVPIDLGSSRREASRSDEERPPSSFDALDESTTSCPVDSINPSILPLVQPCAADGVPRRDEEALDEAAAVGSLFRTFRRHNSVSDNAPALSPNSVASGAGVSNAGSVSSGDCAGGVMHAPVAVAVTLFRSLHGDHCVPPVGCLGTRLMFTLLNGTDVTAFDFKDTDFGNTRGSSSALSSPEHRPTAHLPISPFHQRTTSQEVTRSRANSAAPTISPQLAHQSSPAMTVGTPRGGALDPQPVNVSSTTSIVAMPHHHTFRYPAVRSIDDVRALYASLFADAQVILSPHDPLRAAITLNYAEFVALGIGQRAFAAEMITDYLDEIEMEPIQPYISRLVDLSGGITTPGPAVAPQQVGTTSAFSVTNVRRGGPSSTPMMPPAMPAGAVGVATTPPKPVSTNAAQLTPITDFLPSWQNKDERIQFTELVGLLKAALATLTAAVANPK